MFGCRLVIVKSMRTRTRPNSRCSGGASTSTPRTRSLGTVRTEREHRDRWITERLENLSVSDQQLLQRAAELLEELVAR